MFDNESNQAAHSILSTTVFRIVTLSCAAIATLSFCSLLLAEEKPIGEPKITSKDHSHWAFQPLRELQPPIVQKGSLAQTPIDSFILSRLEEADLSLLDQAPPETLVRRLHFDLTGLPPAFDDARRFAVNPSDAAYERLVDDLLASPAYGERWAQHWLDAVRYAESDGFEHDIERPEAWRYRDWVIDALNADLPYDQFLSFQIAGDLLESRHPGAKVATGFLLAGPDMPDINLAAERRHNVLNDVTSTVGAVFLGLGVGCAQCHDHKYDPVSQADFYRLRAFFDQIDFPAKNKQLGPYFKEAAEQQASHLMLRGAFDAPGPELLPDFPRVVKAAMRTSPSPKSGSPLTRTDLADWLTAETNPLVARVMVNRVWHHHFGRPIVGTPTDFGAMGNVPTHPELLDWLARWFIDDGWSLKRLHKLIVMSSAYRQQSRPAPDRWASISARDPENTLLSRSPRRRLSGEVIRDTLLMAAGRLNRDAHGPSVRPPLPPEVTSTLLKNQWNVTEDTAEHHRRSIYVFARRNLKFPMFDVFDRPDALAACPKRNESTTAIQSLALLNSGLVRESAQWIAHRIGAETSPPEDHVRRAYQLLFARDPAPEEIQLGVKFLELHESADGAVLSDYCLALINSAEFVFID